MPQPSRLLSRFLACLLLSLAAMATGCDDDNKKASTDATQEAVIDDAKNGEDIAETAPAATTGNVTGVWTYKHEIMRLKQTGSSIQGTTEAAGFVVDPADPIEHPVRTVGSMQANGTVKLTELVTYLANPAKSFNVVKSGGLRDANTLVLNVTSGQAPHTQTWIKK